MDTSTPPRIWERVASCLVVYLLFFGCYGLVNRSLPLSWCMDFSTRLDRVTPFVPELIWPFYAAYWLILVPAFAVRTRPALARATLAFAVLVATSCLLFLLVPVQVPRPTIVPDSLSGWLVAGIFGSDRPVCGFPSLHVSGSVLATAALFRDRRLLGWLFLPAAVATSLATVFVKQHVLVDVAGGLAIALLIDRLILAAGPIRNRLHAHVPSMAHGSHGPPKADAWIIERRSSGTVLSQAEVRWQRFYDRLAPRYDGFCRVADYFLLGPSASAQRHAVIDKVGIRPGDTVLEVATGSGRHLPHLAEIVGPSGRLIAVDFSLPMLVSARKRVHSLPADAVLVRANASFLPFADETFDVGFLLDGLNIFDEPRRALAELARVVRVGGVVAYGDWAMNPTRPDTLWHRVLARVNPCLRREPVSAATPMLGHVEHHWVLGGLAYLCVARRQA